jgi:peptidoglycan hydrolase-like protein with peptidoglycan-binding domain
VTEPASVPGRRWRRPAVTALIGVAGVAAAAVVVAAVTGRLGGGDRPVPAPPPRQTAKVERTTLSEGRTVSGELAYSSAPPLAARLSGTVTALPAAGTVVRPGGTLYEVDDQPVVLMNGTTPAYRALAAGTSGPDVRQLERNLADLGYSGFTVDDKFSASTAHAVRHWQKDHGLKQTGSVELGRVVFRPAPVRVGTHRVQLGNPLGDGATVYDTTGTDRHVEVKLARTDAGLGRMGGEAAVVLPGSGKSVPGRVTEVGDPSGDGIDAKIPVVVTVADQKALGGIAGRTVDVRLVATRHRNVLAVPVVALLAVGDSGYGVEVVTGEQSHIVQVTVGLFAGSMVEVTGGGIAEGTEVVVPSA